MQVILTASILIFSSLAGCLGTEDEDEPYIMTSTYHVGQLVSAIVGDTMNVEVLAPSNVPVHDFEPSATDLVRLKDSEMFFYHGLGLETWVDATLDTLGDDKPTSFSTHALPTGETALDYEGILLRELCEHMGEGPYEASNLSEEEGHADDVELHAEHITHTLSFPAHDDHDDDGDHADDNHTDDDHDDHDHADDDHADHSDHDDHDDHGDHDDHNHAEPMEKIEQVTGCPEDTVVYIYELEEGEYVVEFETEDEDHSTFNMVALKMGGAHAHHDHGDHDDNGDDHDDHGDDHSDHDDHGDDHSDHDDHDDHDEEMTPEMALEMFDTNNDSMLSWDEFMDSMDDDHDDHESDMVCYDMSTHTVDMTYTNQTDCEAAGLMWTESSGHDDHDEEEIYQAIWNESDTNMDGNLNVTELEHFIHEMEELDREEGVGYAVIHIEAEGEYGFAIPHDVEMFILSEGDGHEGHDDHGDDHDDHDDHGDDDHDDHGDDEALAYDPHSWLDPVAFKAQASFVLEELKKAYPDLADTFQSNADAFMMSLDNIDTEYKAAFGDGGTCAKNSVAANHNAYAYIAYRYDIEFVTVHGLDPEGEPSAADIAKVVEKIGEDEIGVLFVEEYTDVNAVNSIVDQTKSSTMPDGVSVLTLYTMELPPKDSNEDYLSLMQKNLDNLKTGLSC
jgi:ABC-type Zn uptake system ZnuABC Zn-binding protein ZnuA